MTTDTDAFRRHGFLGPFKVFTAAECSVILCHAATLSQPQASAWNKAWGATDRLFYDLATRPVLLAPLTALLGLDVVLWGASIVRRRPGEAHAWHTDIESSATDGRFVSAWIGLENAGADSALQFIDGSHAFGQSLQQSAREHGMPRGTLSDDDVLALARRRDPGAKPALIPAGDGDAVLFDGRVWHGSLNRRQAGTRTALLLQYAAADQPVHRPDPSRLEWPFQMLPSPRPPVVVVSGQASPAINRLVAPPGASPGQSAPPADLPVMVRQLALPLAEDATIGRKHYPMFVGSTPNLDRMSCHVSVLSPGRSPHRPHAHLDEELLIVLSGTAQLVIATREDDPAPRLEAVGPGDFAYYPPYQHHTIENDGPTPVTYLMFRWRTAPVGVERPLAAGIFRCGGASPAATGAVDARLVVEGPTFGLSKLHAHVTTLQPAAGYAPHRDDHDGAIIPLSGAIEAFGSASQADGDGPGQRRIVQSGGVVYYPAGQPHGLRNPGDGPARYLVFEFHAGAAGTRRAAPAVRGVEPPAEGWPHDRLAHARRWICRRGAAAPPAEIDRFDRAWYLIRYPDVAAAGADPEEHYRRFGAREGRMPSPSANGDGLFDRAAYLKDNPDVAAAGVNPFEHYVISGAAEGRRARACFDSAWYVSQDPAVLQSGLNPLVHYFKLGRYAGRTPHRDAMPDGSPLPLHESIDWKPAADVRRQIAHYRTLRSDEPRRLVVCTAIFGGRDSLMLPDRIDPACDYVCFSDEAWNGHGVWQLRPAPYRHADPVRMARFVKTHLASLFPTHEVAIWVDANIAIRGDLKAYVDTVRDQGAAIGAIAHPFRHCVYDEAQACKIDNRDVAEIIDRQMERYRQAGVPRDDGLLASSLYVLRLDQPGVAAFQEAWWQEIDQFSRRDQLSLGWALKQAGLPVAHLLPPGQWIWDHVDFSLFPHEQ